MQKLILQAVIKKHALIFLSLLFIAAAFLPLNSVAEKWKPETLPMVFLQNDHRFVCNPDGVLSDTAVFTYKVDNIYAPQAECSIRYDDPKIGIAWPITNPQELLLSEKDLQHAVSFDEAEKF